METQELIEYIAKHKPDLSYKNKIHYYNIACAFDIETTSFYIDESEVISTHEYAERKKRIKNYEVVKGATMYVWQFAWNDIVVFGRTWKEWLDFTQALSTVLCLGDKLRLAIYVHNLSYEFQFMRKWFNWCEVFATSERKPIYATTDNGIEYRCSYRLSGYSLATVAKNLQAHTISKLTGDLDYTLLRTYKTPLSEKEYDYCRNDVLIVTAYINEKMQEYDGVADIPLTQTGIVRRYVRKQCFKNNEYKLLMRKLTITPSEYRLLSRAFAGGFTHASALYSTQVCYDVTSYDFTSSYPTVLCSEKFPMSKGQRINTKTLTREQFENLLNKYCCLFDIRFTNLKARFLYDNILSYSKCFECVKPTLNNGRIVNAETIGTTLTETDFRCMQQFYTWDNFTLGNFYIYEKAFLPKEIVKSVLELYAKKTTLKDVDGMEVEYLHSKEMLNSIYGMCVTSIVRDNVLYNGGEWNTTNADIDSAINDYNTDRNRFLYYHWGVWCTSYARRNLYTGLIEWGNDYIYSDTDSIKGFNADKHSDYVSHYNEMITDKLETVCRYHGLSYDLIRPKTVKGKIKALGVWDYDGHYTRFKTLGAKRYLVEKDDKTLQLTVAGLNKKSAMLYINDNSGNAFDFFNDGMYIPSDSTGKNTHTYIDNEMMCVMKDYLGQEATVYEKSAVHLSESDYLLSLSDLYLQYLSGVRLLTSDK